MGHEWWTDREAFLAFAIRGVRETGPSSTLWDAQKGGRSPRGSSLWDSSLLCPPGEKLALSEYSEHHGGAPGRSFWDVTKRYCQGLAQMQ